MQTACSPILLAPQRADAVVVGAGIVGASCALRLAELGQRVIVLEREPAPAAGSTGRSAAGVRVQFSEEVNIRLSAASIAEYRTMPQAAYRPIGYLFLVPESLWDAHLRAAALQQRLGMPVRVLSIAEAAATVPSNPAGIAGATFGDADGVVDPHGITFEWLRQARALGVQLRLGCAAETLERDAGRWRVGTPGGEIIAGAVVNAAGAWAGRVAALAGLSVPVEPAHRTVYATGPLSPPRRYPLTIDAGSGVWLRPEGERLIFGLSDPSERGFREGVDWPWLETVYPTALERFPWFEQLSIDRRACWWGYYEVTPDHQPILGPMPDAPGWYNACGFSGHGVQQAAAVGRVVAAEIAGQAAVIDVSPLRIERLQQPAPRREQLIV
ncbi:MAG TPA: FAD-dependent oxidoreductase [Burkholderiaceae bacterium]|nr:FAD-dependent oxidoreductase [Burkholderiaceae bacterium]